MFYGHNPVTMCAYECYIGQLGFQSMCFLEMHSSAQPNCMYMSTWASICAGLEQFIRVDVWYGLSPVTERAELRQDKGLVLLFTQQREHMLHQLTKPAVTVEKRTRSERQTETRYIKALNTENLEQLYFSLLAIT